MTTITSFAVELARVQAIRCPVCCIQARSDLYLRRVESLAASKAFYKAAGDSWSANEAHIEMVAAKCVMHEAMDMLEDGEFEHTCVVW